MLNLLSNAFKFTFEGEIEVSLRLVGEAVRLTVRDTGTGIPAEELPRLFERFHRVKNARGRSFEGSGIGLALVKELVRLHGGEVTCGERRSGAAAPSWSPSRWARRTCRPTASKHRATRPPTGAGPEAFVQEALRWLPNESRDDFTDAHSGQQLDGASGTASDPHSEDDLAGSRILVADDNSDMRRIYSATPDRLRRRGGGGRRRPPSGRPARAGPTWC